MLLLPWAALPWIVGLTMRAAAPRRMARPGRDRADRAHDRRGQRLGAGARRARARALDRSRAASAVGHGPAPRSRPPARIAVLDRRGLGVVDRGLCTCRARVACRSSSSPRTSEPSRHRRHPGDILRGLGNWFFYGYDRSGHVGGAVNQTTCSNQVVVFVSYLVPGPRLPRGRAGALAPPRLLRRVRGRRHRRRGRRVALRRHDALGRLWKRFTSDTSVGLALRNSAPSGAGRGARASPGCVGAGVGAVRPSTARRVAAVAVAAVVALAFLPVWRNGYLTPGVERPEHIPAYWKDAIHALDAGDHQTRILEVPGSAFATYRWGNTVEPITPGLTTRPYIAREVLPAGSPESFNLLDAFDHRIQNGSFEAVALAPLARLFGIGTVALRSDLAYERSGTPHPRVVWDALTDPRPPGIGAPRTFGPRTDEPRRDRRRHRPAHRDRRRATPGGPVPRPATDDDRAHRGGPRSRRPRGRRRRDRRRRGRRAAHRTRARCSSSRRSSDAALDHALRTGAALVLTDSNRRRTTSYFASIRDTKGATLRAGQHATSADGYDAPSRPVRPHVGCGADGRRDQRRRGRHQQRRWRRPARGPRHPRLRRRHRDRVACGRARSAAQLDRGPPRPRRPHRPRRRSCSRSVSHATGGSPT